MTENVFDLLRSQMSRDQSTVHAILWTRNTQFYFNNCGLSDSYPVAEWCSSCANSQKKSQPLLKKSGYTLMLMKTYYLFACSKIKKSTETCSDTKTSLFHACSYNTKNTFSGVNEIKTPIKPETEQTFRLDGVVLDWNTISN